MASISKIIQILRRSQRITEKLIIAHRIRLIFLPEQAMPVSRLHGCNLAIIKENNENIAASQWVTKKTENWTSNMSGYFCACTSSVILDLPHQFPVPKNEVRNKRMWLIYRDHMTVKRESTICGKMADSLNENIFKFPSPKTSSNLVRSWWRHQKNLNQEWQVLQD